MSDPKPKTAKKKTPAAAVPKKAPPIKREPKPEPHYTVGVWHELPNYQCARCPWSTLSEDEMIKHVAEEHLKMPSVVRTDTGFVTPTGAKIIREEVMTPGEDHKEV